MSEKEGAGAPGPGAPGKEGEPLEYQPPAIAWEEPLQAIAASSCGLIPIECAGIGGGGTT